MVPVAGDGDGDGTVTGNDPVSMLGGTVSSSAD